MHELGHVDQLIGRGLHFGAHPLEAAAARLQVGDAIDVVIGHGDGEVFGGLAGQRKALVLAASGLVADQHVGEQVEIVLAVGDILEIDHSLQPGADHVVGGGREIGLRARDQRVIALVADRRELRSALLGAGLRRRRRLAGFDIGGGAVVAERESAQAGFDPDTGGSDGSLERRALERQYLGGGERAEQHRRDDATRLFRQPGHVEGDELFGGHERGLEDSGSFPDAVARRLLFHHRIGAVRRGDEAGAVGRDQATLDGTAGFHQLGADDEIDLAGHHTQR